MGTRGGMDEGRAEAVRDRASLPRQRLLRADTSRPRSGVERHGVEFGFIPRPPQEPDEDWCVTVEPGDDTCSGCRGRAGTTTREAVRASGPPARSPWPGRRRRTRGRAAAAPAQNRSALDAEGELAERERPLRLRPRDRSRERFASGV